eukprot:5460241-Ditylum_brightwellii.AAC.1
MEMDGPIAFTAKHDPDTKYFQQAMKQLDAPQFVEAKTKDTNEVLKGIKILDAVWAMKCKRDIKTRKISKYKARLNVHSGQ